MKFSKRSLIRSIDSRPRARNSPFHIMHCAVTIPISQPHTEGPPTQTTPESRYDEASHVLEDLVDSAHASLPKYHDAMKESYYRSRRPTSVKVPVYFGISPFLYIYTKFYFVVVFEAIQLSESTVNISQKNIE